ncbi:MAG TPA: hypothetical protein VJB98_03795 [Candidatus Paceibacterota bacterium]
MDGQVPTKCGRCGDKSRPGHEVVLRKITTFVHFEFEPHSCIMPFTTYVCGACIKLNDLDRAGNGRRHCELTFDPQTLKFRLTVPGSQQPFVINIWPLLRQTMGVGG